MVKTKTALSQTNLNAVKQVPYLDIDSSPDVENKDADKIDAKGVVLFDPQGGGVYGSANPEKVQISDGTNLVAVTQQALQNNLLFASGVISPQYLYNASTTFIEIARTPVVYKSGLFTAAGSTAIWTSGVGKKWRLMGWRATLVNGTTAAAASLLTLLDVAAATGIGCQVCGAALGAVGTSAIIANESFMNGYLAAATNTALNVNLSSALAVAGVFVQVWGTEE